MPCVPRIPATFTLLVWELVCAFSALTLLVGGRNGIRPVKTEQWDAGVVICLEQSADLHMAQLVPLPLTGSCFSKIQIGFTFLVPAHPTRVVPDKWPLNVRVCLWVSGSRRQPWWFSEARVRGGGECPTSKHRPVGDLLMAGTEARCLIVTSSIGQVRALPLAAVARPVENIDAIRVRCTL